MRDTTPQLLDCSALGQLVRRKRLELGLSRERFAVGCDLTGNYIWKLEQGSVSSPGYIALAHIAHGLGYSSVDAMVADAVA